MTPFKRCTKAWPWLLLASIGLRWAGPCAAAARRPQPQTQPPATNPSNCTTAHRRPSPPTAVALTLDACSGAFDQRLIDLLVELRVPATLFVTKRWLDRRPID